MKNTIFPYSSDESLIWSSTLLYCIHIERVFVAEAYYAYNITLYQWAELSRTCFLKDIRDRAAIQTVWCDLRWKISLGSTHLYAQPSPSSTIGFQMNRLLAPVSECSHAYAMEIRGSSKHNTYYKKYFLCKSE